MLLRDHRVGGVGPSSIRTDRARHPTLQRAHREVAALSLDRTTESTRPNSNVVVTQAEGVDDQVRGQAGGHQIDGVRRAGSRLRRCHGAADPAALPELGTIVPVLTGSSPRLASRAAAALRES